MVKLVENGGITRIYSPTWDISRIFVFVAKWNRILGKGRKKVWRRIEKDGWE